MFFPPRYCRKAKRMTTFLKKTIIAICTLSATAFTATFAKEPPPGAPNSVFNGGQAELKRVQLRAGMHIISAEVADNMRTRSDGLMMRNKMAQNQGMLFVFERAEPHCFWMRNTLLPLSIAFIDDNGVIVNIADMKPQSDDSHCSKKPVRYALEMNQGWFAAKGIKAESIIGGIKP
jgi:uncharacterized protein